MFFSIQLYKYLSSRPGVIEIMNLKIFFSLLFYEHRYRSYYLNLETDIFSLRSKGFSRGKLGCLRIYICALVFILCQRRVTFGYFLKLHFLFFIK